MNVLSSFLMHNQIFRSRARSLLCRVLGVAVHKATVQLDRLLVFLKEESSVVPQLLQA